MMFCPKKFFSNFHNMGDFYKNKSQIFFPKKYHNLHTNRKHLLDSLEIFMTDFLVKKSKNCFLINPKKTILKNRVFGHFSK